MNFLAPTDFSNNAKNATQYAAMLTQATNSNLRLLHIVSPPIIGSDKLDTVYKEKVSHIKTDVAIKLEEICKNLKANYSNIECDYVIRIGEISSKIIVSAAHNDKADFIVMGAQGTGLIKKIFLGSITTSVIEDSQIPVFVIPENISFLPPKKIVYASDFQVSDLNAIKQLTVLASAFDSEIIIVHIDEDKNRAKSGFSNSESFSELVGKATPYPKISYRTFKNEKAEHGIEQFIDTVNADIVALSARDRNPLQKLFSKSITKEMSFHSKIPLLVFRTQNTEKKDDN